MLSGVGETQDVAAEIRGFVVSRPETPLAQARIEARDENGRLAMQYATSIADGSYRLADVMPGRYTLKLSASGFSSTEIRNVEVANGRVTVVPAVRLEVGLIADCWQIVGQTTIELPARPIQERSAAS